MEPKEAWDIMKLFVESFNEEMTDKQKEAYKIVFIDDIRIDIINAMTQQYLG